MIGATRNHAGGHVHGVLLQGRDITVQLPPPPPLPVPAQLPRLGVRHFVDRVEETARLTGWHAADQADLVVVSGQAGIGKTALVLRWAAGLAATFTDGQLHADFAAEPDLTAHEVLRRWLRALGMAPAAVPAHPAEQTALWRSTTHRSRLLLVLDGVLTAGQVLPLLPSSPHALTVVASRHPLPELAVAGARQLALDGLPEPAVVELLAHYAGPDRAAREQHHLRRLVAGCRGNPLATALLGGHLATHPNLPVAAVTDRRHVPVELSWSTTMRTAEGDLPSTDRTLLGVVRAVDGPGLTADTIGLLGLPARHVDAAVRRLLDAGLVQQITEPGDIVRYRVPHLPSDDDADADATVPATPNPPAVTTALTRLVEHYLRLISAVAETLEPGKHAYSDLRATAALFPEAGTARALFDRERATTIAVLRLADDLELHDQAWKLAEALWVPLRSGGHARDVLATQRLAVVAARALGHVYEATALARCAWALTWLRRAREAIEHAQQAVALAEQHGDDWALATALSTQARALGADGRQAAALEMLDRCIVLDVRAGSPSWVVGLRWRHKAEAYWRLGGLDEARAAAATAVWLILADPRPRRVEAARALTMLAEILIDLGLAEEAHRELTRAAELLDVGADHVYRGEVHQLLFRTATTLGHARAGHHLALAVSAFDRAGHPQRADALREQLAAPELPASTPTDRETDSAAPEGRP